jgi:hypothetical protein
MLSDLTYFPKTDEDQKESDYRSMQFGTGWSLKDAWINSSEEESRYE